MSSLNPVGTLLFMQEIHKNRINGIIIYFILFNYKWNIGTSWEARTSLRYKKAISQGFNFGLTEYVLNLNRFNGLILFIYQLK